MRLCPYDVGAKPGDLPVGVLYTLDGCGGGEHDVVELARRFDPGQFRLVFTTLTDEAAEVGESLRRHGAEVRHCPLGRSFPSAFGRMLRQVRPRVVQSRAAAYSPLVLALARLCGVPRRVVHLSAGDGRCSVGRYPAGRRPVGRGWDGLRRCAGGLVLDAWATDIVGGSEVALRRAWGEAWRLDPRCRLIYPGIAIEPLGVAIAARHRAVETAIEIGGDGGEDEQVTVVHVEAVEPAASVFGNRRSTSEPRPGGSCSWQGPNVPGRRPGRDPGPTPMPDELYRFGWPCHRPPPAARGNRTHLIARFARDRMRPPDRAAFGGPRPGRGQPGDGSQARSQSRMRAVDVLSALRGRGVDARLRVVGRFEPGEVDALRAQARHRGVAAHVSVVDVDVDVGTLDVPKLLVAASMLLSTTSQDSGELSRSMLQACAVGTPVLSADPPAVREIARMLPCVTMLPLGADDEVWADTARVLTAVPPSLDNRRECLRAFVRSPFTADAWQRAVTDLWS